VAKAPYEFSDAGPVQPVAPETIAARQTIQASPEAFGAPQGRALEQVGQTAQHLGQEALTASNFYGQVAADDGMNKLQAALDKVKYGDPSTAGPDGQPDTGFLGKRGADAMGSYKPTMEQVDQQIKEIRDGLSSPKSQFEFDRYSQRMRSEAFSRLGTHYEQESKTWATGVNKAAVQTNLTDIARDPDNDDLFNHRLADMQAASDKNVHLAGGGDAERESGLNAMASAAWKTRIESIGVKDPTRAAQLADQHKAELGLHYDDVANSLRARATHAEGSGAAQEEFNKARGSNEHTNPRNPIFLQAATYIPGGMSPSGMARTFMVESGGRAEAGAGTSHQGFIQASTDYWKNYGGGGSMFNPVDSAYALARSTAHDRQVLAQTLGRDPSDAELYLAHQQGPGGAKALFANPNLPAADALVVGGAYRTREMAAKAISGNRGDPNAPASVFTTGWINRFNNTPGAAPGNSPAEPAHDAAFTGIPQHHDLVKADAYNALLNRNYSSPEARDVALSEFHKLYAAQQVADQQTEKNEKQANSDAANDLITAIHSGQADRALSILGNNSDPRLTDPHMREWLWNIAMQDPDNSPARDMMRFGPKYAEALDRMTKEPGDPNRLGSEGDLVKMLSNHEITAGGYKELHGLFQTMKKNDNGPLYTQVLNSQIQYARRQLKLDETFDFPGMPKVVNKKGEDIFDKKFLPAYNDALRVAQEKGTATEFLRDDNTDKFLAPYLKEARQGAMDAKVGALGVAREQATPAQLAKEQQFLVAPKDIPQDKWDALVAQPPELPSGQKTSPARWGAAIQLLDKNRDQKHFDYWREALPNVDPMQILQQLDAERGKKPVASTPAHKFGAIGSLAADISGKAFTSENLSEIPHGQEVEGIRGQR
jgi:hypothetical protein